MSIKSDIVKKYLKEFPTVSSAGLARKIYKENSVAFNDAENVRTIIRYYRGASGKRDLKKLTDKSMIRLPEEAESKDFSNYILPNNANNCLILSDIHIPYHKNKYLEKALKYGKDNKVNTIILNGDTLDCYRISRYQKDPRKRDFNGELEDARQFLSYLRQEFPDAHIYWKNGNHEARYEDFLKRKAPELFNIPEFKLDILLRMGEKKIHFIENKRIIVAGEFHILHGDEFLGGGTVFPARALFQKMGVSGMCGHFHRQSEFIGKNLAGKEIKVYTSGCLCELTPEYMPHQKQDMKWSHGFGHLVWSKHGFEHQNIRL